MSKQKPRSKLNVSCITMQNLEQKESHTKASQTKVPRAEKPHAKKLHIDEKLLIILSSLLPGDFFAEEALVTLCTLENNEKIKITVLLDIRVTKYFFINPSIACCVCDKLQIEPIRLSKPKVIWGFDSKQALNVIYTIYSTMTVQDHKETITSMLITKLSQHQIIFWKPCMKNTVLYSICKTINSASGQGITIITLY